MTEPGDLPGLRKLQLLNATELKIIGLVCMLLDHLGVAFFPEKLWLRAVGRIAMPVFAFCVSEGFLHTRSRKRYFLRLLIFGVVSEIPFDLFTSGKLLEFGHQNIMLTFAWTLAGLICYEAVSARRHSGLSDIASAFLLLGFIAGSLLLRLDHDMAATALIFVFYLLSGKASWMRDLPAAALYAASRGRGVDWFGLAGFIPVFMYNGRKGRGLKWLFYVFYPVHLMLLWLTGRIF